MIINRLDMYRTTTRHLIHGPDYAKQNVDIIGDIIGDVIGNVTSHVTGINLIVTERRASILKCMLIIKKNNTHLEIV